MYLHKYAVWHYTASNLHGGGDGGNSDIGFAYFQALCLSTRSRCRSSASPNHSSVLSSTVLIIYEWFFSLLAAMERAGSSTPTFTSRIYSFVFLLLLDFSGTIPSSKGMKFTKKNIALACLWSTNSFASTFHMCICGCEHLYYLYLNFRCAISLFFSFKRKIASERKVDVLNSIELTKWNFDIRPNRINNNSLKHRYYNEMEFWYSCTFIPACCKYQIIMHLV